MRIIVPATTRHDLLTDELRLITPAGWSGRSLPSLASRPFVMEPVGTTAREWATAVCRQAGFEPEVRYTSTDLQIHLRLVESGLAAALLPAKVQAATTALRAQGLGLARTWPEQHFPAARANPVSPGGG
jgi:DNA-binding transcriptional LysR family regulator